MEKVKNLNGQLTLWDIEIAEFINKNILIKNEKISISSGITERQQNFLDENKIMKNNNLSRVIKYCAGGLGIESAHGEEFKTIYINKDGIEEFTFNKKSSVLPMDQVLYYNKNLKINNLQEDRLKELKQMYKDIKEIRRKGDENIILEVQDKVISINSKGWVLEFINIKALYKEEEIITAEKETINIDSIRKSVKVGDKVEAMIGNEAREGIIKREYGICNEILNIELEKSVTAIGRRHVIKILKAS